MSTTVTYKGQTLTTVSNDTKTLLTEGKYLEDDLTLVDVSGGGAVLTTKNISANGTYNASSDSADGYSQVTVAVPASAVDTGTKSITSNGTHDVVGYASASVAVPNSYSAGDEGKVVDNGALVAQTAHADVTPTTSDQTIDTTTNDSVKVKGDADLVASNIKKDVEIFGVTGTYEGGGGGYSIDDLASGAPTGAIAITASTIEQYAFTNKRGLTSVSAPNCTMVKANAFEGCSGLTAISFPEVLTISGYAFNGCSSLTSAAFPKLTSGTGTRGFASCSSLETLDMGRCASIDGQCFYSSGALRTLILRNSSVTSCITWNAIVMGGIYNNPTESTIYVPEALITAYQSATNWSSAYAAGVSFVKIEGSIYE